MKRVLFITKVSFLDAALEYISEVKGYVDLHVLIEIDPNSCRSNILDVTSLPRGKYFVPPADLLNREDHVKLAPYIQGCGSFAFMVHRSAKSLNIPALFDSFALYRYIRSIRPEVLHFDDVSVRLLSLLFFLRKSRKIIVNAHDPVPHSGEHDRNNMFARKVYYRKAAAVLTFSLYSQRLFRQQYGNRPLCMQIPLKPYSIYRAYRQQPAAERKYITFIGRLSPYKGIDLFVEAMHRVVRKFPQQQFIIAGKPAPGFDMPLPSATYLSLYTRHLSTTEMSDIISRSLAVVCPYKDATQSGVIMTAYALDTPVVVTNVGGLPEYVQEGVTGYITAANADALAAACERFVSGEALAGGFDQYTSSAFTIGKEKIMAIYN